jgi:hypothetical protein
MCIEFTSNGKILKQYSNFTEMNKNPSNHFQESSLSNPHYPTGILLPFLTGSSKNVKYQGALQR